LTIVGRGHGLVFLLAIEEELLGLKLEEELLKDIFNTREKIFSLNKSLKSFKQWDKKKGGMKQIM
jgi:hypothetical protein